MSILADEFIDKTRKSNITVCINNRWYFARSLSPSMTLKRLVHRILDAFNVLVGTSIAVHYKEDEWKVK